ncbi:unnamed protein product [Dracunculus medinensis]|uniref:Uncharacterized protein n=1 Tax=Dracunculus medinensis TaxID=318479 RepID=A0A0N4U967_DRAME|nr:unnamed protein product [Dracunculus medinensis]
MVEIETQNFLRELDSFGLPPPPQKLFSNNYSKAFSREFENKLHHINVEKQMRKDIDHSYVAIIRKKTV